MGGFFKDINDGGMTMQLLYAKIRRGRQTSSRAPCPVGCFFLENTENGNKKWHTKMIDYNHFICHLIFGDIY